MSECIVKRDNSGRVTTVYSSTPLNNSKNDKQETRGTRGARLFNRVNPEASTLSKKYKEEKGITTPEGELITTLDKKQSKKVSDAYDKLKHEPNNPQVKESYAKLAEEVRDQYKVIVDAGYTIELHDSANEPYSNSAEVIDDMIDNRHLYVLATDVAFGGAEMSTDNPLLKTSEYTDINGKPLLYNDLFRAVHDFFGHGERGNSFGAIGEEIAWDVHARMFSPLARRAMTTETRGQNSWVNFSGVNDAAQAKLKQARELELKGKLVEAQKLRDEGISEFKYAEQKVGLLPEWVSNLPKANKARPQDSVSSQSSGIGMQSLNTQGVITYLRDNLGLSVVANRDQMTKKLEDLGYAVEFLKTPMGNIYGFVGADNVIYIDPDLADLGTIFHEQHHIWDKALTMAAKRGDKVAASILDKRASIVANAVTGIKEFFKKPAKTIKKTINKKSEANKFGKAAKAIIAPNSSLANEFNQGIVTAHDEEYVAPKGDVSFAIEDLYASVSAKVEGLDVIEDKLLVKALAMSQKFSEYKVATTTNKQYRQQLNTIQKQLQDIYRNNGDKSQVVNLKSQILEIKEAIKQSEVVKMTKLDAKKILLDEINEFKDSKSFLVSITDEYLDNSIAYHEKRFELAQVGRFQELKDNDVAREQQTISTREQQISEVQASLDYLLGNDLYSTEFVYIALNNILTKTRTTEGKIIVRSENTVAVPNSLNSTVSPSLQEALMEDVDADFFEVYEEAMKLGYPTRSELVELVNTYKVEDRPNGYWLKVPQNREGKYAEDLNKLTADTHNPEKSDIDAGSWCTGAAISTAVGHNKQGDFYLFVSKDYDVKLAMKYTKDRLDETRGIGKGQGILEEDLAEQKHFFDNYPDGKRHLRVHSFNVLYKKLQEGNLTPRETYKLYNVQDAGDGSYNRWRSKAKVDKVKEYLQTVKDSEIAEGAADFFGVLPNEVSVQGEVTTDTRVYIGNIRAGKSIPTYNKLEIVQGVLWSGYNTFPNLRKVIGELSLNSDGNDLPVEIVEGFVSTKGVTSDASSSNLPNLKTVTGNVDFRYWNGQAPELETVGGAVSFEGWTQDAPKLKSIVHSAGFNGWLGNAPSLETVGEAIVSGYEYDLPSLEFVGLNLNLSNYKGALPNLKEVELNLMTEGYTKSLPKLKKIGGYASFKNWEGSAPSLEFIGGNASFKSFKGKVPKLKIVKGFLETWFWTEDAPSLEEIGSDAYFENWKGKAPKLKTILGDANFDGWDNDAPSLEFIMDGANFYKWGGRAPKLKKVNGSVRMGKGSHKDAIPKLEYIKLSALFNNWSGDAPALTYIGRDALFSNWEGEAPLLKEIQGRLDMGEVTKTLPKLEVVGGNVTSSLSNVSLPVLDTIGGDAKFGGWGGEAPLLNYIVGNAMFTNWQHSAPQLREIGGSANFNYWEGEVPKLERIGQDATFNYWGDSDNPKSAPALTYIGRDALFSNWGGEVPLLKIIGRDAGFMNAKVEVPLLKVINGAADFSNWEGSAPELEEIGRVVSYRGWTGTAPKLSKNIDVEMSTEITSKVYDRRASETEEQWTARLEGEVSARLVGDNAEQYVKSLNLSDTEAKGILSKIKAWVKDFVEWLKSNLGLAEATVEEISNLSTTEFIDRVTNSQLKGEFMSQLDNSNNVVSETVGEVTTYRNQDTEMVVKPYMNPLTREKLGGIEVDLVNTSPDARGKGSAKKLMKQVLDIYDRKGLTTYGFVSPRDGNTSEEAIIGMLRDLGYTPMLTNGLWDGFSMVRKPKTIKAVDFNIDAPDAKSKTYGQLASQVFVKSNESALDLFYNTQSTKFKGSDYKFDNGEPKAMFGLPDGSFTDSFKEALSMTKHGRIPFGYVYEGNMQAIMNIDSTRDNQSVQGLMNDLIVSGMLSDTKIEQGGKLVYLAAGHKIGYKILNLQNIKDYLIANINIFNIKSNDSLGTFTFKEYDGSQYHYTNSKGDTEVISQEEFDAKRKTGKFKPDELPSLILQRAAQDGQYLIGTGVESAEYTDSEEKLYKTVKDFLNGLGIKTMSMEAYNANYKAKYGVDPDAKVLADIANKVIAFKDGALSKEVLIEEVAHFMVEAFTDQAAIEEVLNSVKFTSEYMAEAAKYREVFAKTGRSAEEVERLVRREILGKILAKQLQDKFEPKSLEDRTIFQRLQEGLSELFTRINNYFTDRHNQKIKDINNRLIDLISRNDMGAFQNDLGTNHSVFYNLNTIPTDYKILIASINKVKTAMDNHFVNNPSRAQVGDINSKMSALSTWAAASTLAATASSEISLIQKLINQQGVQSLKIEHIMSMSTLQTIIIPELTSIRAKLAGLQPLELDGADTKTQRMLQELSDNKTDLLNKIDSVVELYYRASPAFTEFTNKEVFIETAFNNVGASNDSKEIKKTILQSLLTEIKDLTSFTANFGSLINRAHPLIQHIRRLIGNARAFAELTTQTDANKLFKQIRDKGLWNYIENIQKRNTDGKPTNQMLSAVNRYKYNEAKLEFELKKRAEIIKRTEPKRDVSFDGDNWRALKKKTHLTTLEQESELKDAMSKWEREFGEERLKSNYYETREKIYSGLAQTSINQLDTWSREKANIVNSYKDDKGRVDRSKLSSAELERYDSIVRAEKLARSPYTDSGELKMGLKSEYGEIVPDYTVKAEDMTDTEILTRDMIQVTINRNKIQNGALTKKISDDFKNTIKQLEVDAKNLETEANNLRAQGSITEANEKLNESKAKRVAAYNFLMTNGGIAFTDEYWSNSQFSGFVNSYKAAASALFRSNQIDADTHKRYEDLITTYEEQSQVLKKYLSASRVANNPAEVQVSDLHKSKVREVESRLAGIRRSLTTIDVEVSALASTYNQAVVGVEMEYGFNSDYVNELAASNITRGTAEEVEFAKEHLTEDARDRLGIFRKDLERFLLAKSRGEEGTLRVQHQSIIEALIAKEKLTDPNFSINDGMFTTKADIAFMERNITAYYKRSAPKGYEATLAGLKDGSILVSDFIEDTGNKFLAVDSNLTWSETGFDDYLNPKYDPDGTSAQPNREKFLDEEFFSRYGISATQRQEFLAGTIKEDALVANTNKKEYELRSLFVDYRAKQIETLGESKNLSKYSLPNKSKDSREKAKGIVTFKKEAWKAALSDVIQYRYDELEGGALDADGVPISSYSESRTIPKMFVSELEDPNDISEDILSMLINGNHQANIYRGRSDVQNSVMQTLLQAKNIKIKGKENANSNFISVLNEYVDYELYGIKFNLDYEFDAFGYNVNVAKVLSTVNKYVSDVNLKFNIITDATGATTALANRKQIEISEEYFTKESSKAAHKLYRQLMPKYMSEVGKVDKTSKMNYILEYSGVKNLEDRVKFSNLNAGTRVLYKSGYGLSEVSNLTATPLTAIAVMKDIRLIDGYFLNYEQYYQSRKSENLTRAEIKEAWSKLESDSLFDSLDLTDGVAQFTPEAKVKIKDAYLIENTTATSSEIEAHTEHLFGNVHSDVYNKVRHINDRIDGVLSDENRVKAHRNPILNFMMTHRSWLPINIETRLRGEHFNQTTKQMEKGHYLAAKQIFDNVRKYAKDHDVSIAKALPKVLADLSSVERKAIKVIKFDGFVLALTTLIGFLALAAAEDEDNEDNWLVQASALLWLRTASETYSQNAMGLTASVYDIVKQPLVMEQYVDNTLKLFTTDAFREIERGDYKGFTVAQKSALKLWHTRKYMSLINMRSAVQTYRHFNGTTLFLLGEKELADRILE